MSGHNVSGRADAAGTGSAKPPRRRLGRLALLTTALRIVVLEATWNQRGQQSLGLLTVVDPALRILYAGDPARLKEARKRNLGFFNTNPVASGLVIGAALNLEEEMAAGRDFAEGYKPIVLALASTFANEGDRLFWQSWLPACSLAGVLVYLLTGSAWAPLLTPLLFCLAAWPIRIWGVFKGYETGYNVYQVYRLFGGERLIKSLQWVWTVLLAVAAALVFHRAAPPPGPVWPQTLWLVLAAGALWLHRRLCFGHAPRVGFVLYPVLLCVLVVLTAVLS
jgi:mannose/fructose/N-acetylgalactosamine-specific phosphotransferase system component IID